MVWVFSDYFEVSWGILVSGLGDTSENPEIIEMKVFGFSHKQIEKLLVLNEAESFYGAFKHIIAKDLPQQMRKNGRRMSNMFSHDFRMVFVMPVCSEIVKTWRSEVFIFTKICFENDLGCFLDYLSRNHRNDGAWGFSHKQIEKLCISFHTCIMKLAKQSYTM